MGNRTMREIDRQIMTRVNELYDGHDEFFSRFFPDMTVGELVVELYNSGLIPDDVIESILYG